MPALHSSVTLCACDLIVAVSEMLPCEGGCGQKICPECAITVGNQIACSESCAAHIRAEKAAGVLCITHKAGGYQNYLNCM
jgi:hypothetical protein